MRDVSYSQLNTARRCRFKWGLAYLLELHRAAPRAAMDLGRLMHQALHHYYRDVYPSRIAFSEVQQDRFWNQLLADQEEATELADLDQARALLLAYHQRYAEMDLLSDMTIQAIEYGFRVPIPTPAGTASHFRLVGYIDLLTRDRDGQLWIWDHKTGRSFPTRPSLTMDAQLSSYSFVLQRWGMPAPGVRLNLLKTTKEPQFSRLDLRKREEEINHWGEVLYYDCRTLPLDGADWRTLQRNPNINCAWDCEYLDLCRLDMEGERNAFHDLVSMEYTSGSQRRASGVLHVKPPQNWQGDAL